MSNLQTYYHFKLDLQIMDHQTGGTWLIHGTKRRQDNQLQSLEHSYGSLQAEFMGTKNNDHIHRYVTPIFVAIVVYVSKLIYSDNQIVWGL